MFFKKITLFVTVLLFTSCIGTISTRTGGDHIGRYPYQALYIDFYEMPQELIHKDENLAIVPLFIFSFPFDLVIDTVLLPADLITWPFGYEKGGFLDGIH